MVGWDTTRTRKDATILYGLLSLLTIVMVWTIH
jgi:hypothetical protein